MHLSVPQLHVTYFLVFADHCASFCDIRVLCFCRSEFELSSSWRSVVPCFACLWQIRCVYLCATKKIFPFVLSCLTRVSAPRSVLPLFVETWWSLGNLGGKHKVDVKSWHFSSSILQGCQQGFEAQGPNVQGLGLDLQGLRTWVQRLTWRTF